MPLSSCFKCCVSVSFAKHNTMYTKPTNILHIYERIYYTLYFLKAETNSCSYYIYNELQSMLYIFVGLLNEQSPSLRVSLPLSTSLLMYSNVKYLTFYTALILTDFKGYFEVTQLAALAFCFIINPVSPTCCV